MGGGGGGFSRDGRPPKIPNAKMFSWRDPPGLTKIKLGNCCSLRQTEWKIVTRFQASHCDSQPDLYIYLNDKNLKICPAGLLVRRQLPIIQWDPLNGTNESMFYIKEYWGTWWWEVGEVTLIAALCWVSRTKKISLGVPAGARTVQQCATKPVSMANWDSLEQIEWELLLVDIPPLLSPLCKTFRQSELPPLKALKKFSHVWCDPQWIFSISESSSFEGSFDWNLK